MKRIWTQKPPLGVLPNFGNRLSQELVGLWLSNECSGNIVNDLSGNNNEGTFGAGAASPVWSPGKFGSALSFDSGDYIDCGANSSILPDAWTVSAWLKPNDTGDTTEACFFSFGAHTRGICLDFVGKPILYLGTNNYRYFDASAWTTLKDGNWHHVVFKIKGSAQTDVESSEMWLDGVQVGVDSTVATAAQDAKTTCFIGAEDNSPIHALNGLIDHIALYNRMLSTSETEELYREPFYMFGRDPIELWAAAALCVPPVGIPILRRRRESA